MISIVFATGVNIAIAIAFAFGISLCESRKVFFWVCPGIDEKHNLYEVNDHYRALVDEYKQLCRKWPEYKGAGVAKFCIAFLPIYCFAIIAMRFLPKESPVLALLCTVVVPIAILIFLVCAVKKSTMAYREFSRSGHGSRIFPGILSVFYEECDKYSYIENTHEVQNLSKNNDYIIWLLEKRVNIIQLLQAKEYHYSSHWLIFSTIAASICVYTFFKL